MRVTLTSDFPQQWAAQPGPAVLDDFELQETSPNYRDWPCDLNFDRTTSLSTVCASRCSLFSLHRDLKVRDYVGREEMLFGREILHQILQSPEMVEQLDNSNFSASYLRNEIDSSVMKAIVRRKPCSEGILD